MRGYLGAKYGEENYGMQPMSPNDPAGSSYASGLSQGGGETAAAGAPAAGGAGAAAATGNPYVAGAAIAGNFLTSYLAAKAADERQRRDMAMQNEKEYSNNQNSALSAMMSSQSRALR